MSDRGWYRATALAVGDRIPDLTDEPLSRTDFVRYQGASGDMNPIHHDEFFARDAGYQSVFAPRHASGWDFGQLHLLPVRPSQYQALRGCAFASRPGRETLSPTVDQYRRSMMTILSSNCSPECKLARRI